MAIVLPAFTTSAVITSATLISQTDEQLNILMSDVKDYVQDTYLVVASELESTVAIHASNAQQSAVLSASSASASDLSADASQASAVLSQGYADDSEDNKELSRLWAEAPEDFLVDGVGQSAYHWAKVAESVTLGDIFLDSLADVSTAGKVDGDILRYRSGSNDWVPYDFSHNRKLGFNINDPESITEGDTQHTLDIDERELYCCNLSDYWHNVTKVEGDKPRYIILFSICCPPDEWEDNIIHYKNKE